MTSKSKALAPGAEASEISAGEQKLSIAHGVLNPTLSAAITIERAKRGVTFITQEGQPGETVDLPSLVNALTARVKDVHGGDLTRAESMLFAQANALDALFHNLVARAADNMTEYLNAAEIFMRLALRAQNQSRTTLETLAEIMNPTGATFVRQANIAHGPQQVNNTSRTEASRAGKPEIQQDKLLEAHDGERLDIGAASQAISGDTALETVGPVNGAENA